MGYQGIERPKRAIHPTGSEARLALDSLRNGNLRDGARQEYCRILEKVLHEWLRECRGLEGELIKCETPAEDGLPCRRPKGHGGSHGPARPDDYRDTHYCSTHKVDGRCSICGRPEREWLWSA
jgi:hypothetical protein